MILKHISKERPGGFNLWRATSWPWPWCSGKDRDELIWRSATGGYLAPPSGGSWLAHAVARCQAVDPAFPRITAHAMGHANAAMTLDVYADLFYDDLTGVAQRLDEIVGKMWARDG